MGRTALLVFATLPVALAGCSKQNSGGGSAIDAGRAPGVAFSYDYGFHVPDKAISTVQDAHASACEQLGPRCRITGMRYTVGDTGRVDAMLSVGLDPAVARAFGKEAVAVVVRNEGTLAKQDTTGTDASGTIAEADTQTSEAREQLAQVEEKLKTTAAGSAREDLLRQAETLRARITESATAKTGAQTSLAVTPMTFNYASGSLNGGVDLRDAFSTAWSSLNYMIWVIIVVVGALLPWAALAAVGVLGLRYLRGLLRARRRPVVRIAEAEVTG